MDDFEQFLKRQPLRAAPPEWRAEILGAARTRQAGEKPQQPPWWMAWLWPSPTAWAAVACAWLVIIGLNIASRPSETAGGAFASISAADFSRMLVAQRELLHELARMESQPAPEPPRRREVPGACIRRESETQIA